MDDEIKIMQQKVENEFAKRGISFAKGHSEDIITVPARPGRIYFKFEKDGHNVYPVIRPTHIMTRDDVNFVDYITRVIDRVVDSEKEC